MNLPKIFCNQFNTTCGHSRGLGANLATAVSLFCFLFPCLNSWWPKGCSWAQTTGGNISCKEDFQTEELASCVQSQICGIHSQKRHILPLPAQRTHTASKSPTLNSGLGFIQCLQVRCQCYFINKPQPSVPYRAVCSRGTLGTDFTRTHRKLCSSACSQCLRKGGKGNAFNKKKTTLNIKHPFAADN